MKRLYNFILAGIMIAALSACGQQEQSATLKTAQTQTEHDAAGGKEQPQIQEENDTVAGERSFNFETKTVRLNSGYEMPIYGIGTYSLTGIYLHLVYTHIFM